MNRHLVANRLYLSASLIILAVIITIIAVNVLTTLQLYFVWRGDVLNFYQAYLERGMPGYLFHKYMGHPLVFLKSTLVVDWSLFKATGKAVIITGIICNMTMAAILWHALSLSRRGDAPLLSSLLSGVLLTGGVFWMTRYMEFAYPAVTGTTLAITGAALAAYCLYRHLQLQPAWQSGWPIDRWWWLMIASCFFASFSNGGGIASWAGVFMALMLLRVMPARIFLLCGLGACAAIMSQLMPMEEEVSLLPTLLENLPNPREFTTYFLLFMGLPFNFAIFPFEGTHTGMPLLSGIAGLIGVVIFIVYSWFSFRRREDRPSATVALPLALGWFAIVAVLVTTLGRAGFEGGWGNPVHNRYTGWSVALWIALLWLALYHLQPYLQTRAIARCGLIGLAALCLMLYVPASYHGISYLLEYNRDYHLAGLAATTAPETRMEDMRNIWPFRTDVPPLTLPEMRRRGHGLFAENWTRQLGDELTAHYEITRQESCHGVWQELREERVEGSRVYEGWTIGPQGSFDAIVMVSNDKIIGGGRPVWLGDIRALGENTRVTVAHPRQYFLGMLFGHTPGWLAIANLAEANARNETEISAYGLIDDNTVCRIEPVPS